MTNKISEHFNRQRSVDVLKGVCAIIIIFTHYTWSNEERLKYLFPFWVDMAVPMFMIISGYLGAKSFIRYRIDTFEKAYELNYILRKYIRYTIPFTIAFLIEIVFLLCVGGVLKTRILFLNLFYFISMEDMDQEVTIILV